MNTYKVNEFNVCENATEYLIYQGNEGKVVLKTAFLDGKWRGGNSILCKNYGFGGLPSLYDKPFDTERECVENELNWAENYLKSNGETRDFGKIFKLKLEELFPREQQLSLF